MVKKRAKESPPVKLVEEEDIPAPKSDEKEEQTESLIPEVETLSVRQKEFCEQYIIDLNATKAAIRAHYSAASARQVASQLLSKHYIQHYIAELMEKRGQRTSATADNVVNELKSLAFSNIKNIASWDETGKVTVVPSDELTHEVAASIESIKMERHIISKKVKDNYNEEETVTEEEIKTTLTVKLHKKTPPLFLLMKHLGMLEGGEGEENPVIRKALEEIKRGRG